MEINKYHNSKIYKLISDHTDKIYIGSTVQPLHKRIHGHKRDYQLFKNNQIHYVSSYELIDLGEIDIILIENIKCESKEELHAKERYHIELNKELCVNKNIPKRSKEETKEQVKKYYEDNTERSKEYRKENSEKINQYQNEYRKSNKEYQKEYHKQYQSEEINCECGTTLLLKYKLRHLKTKKHLKYITDLNSV
jgi:hypothetical protein